MEVTNITKNKATITVSIDELSFLCKAINEALESVEEWEFNTRTGETRKRAMEIQEQCLKILDQSNRIDDSFPE